MSVHITPDALEVLRRSIEMAGITDGGVRLRPAGGEIRPRFASGPEEGDEIVEAEGVRVFVDPRITAETPDVEIGVTAEHETLVVRPVRA